MISALTRVQVEFRILALSKATNLFQEGGCIGEARRTGGNCASKPEESCQRNLGWRNRLVILKPSASSLSEAAPCNSMRPGTIAPSPKNATPSHSFASPL